jgi:hypothetical protein
LEDDLDVLDDFQILKRRKIVEMKMYVHFQKSAAGFGNWGTMLAGLCSTTTKQVQ